MKAEDHSTIHPPNPEPASLVLGALSTVMMRPAKSTLSTYITQACAVRGSNTKLATKDPRPAFLQEVASPQLLVASPPRANEPFIS
eukprot:5951612-Amphidinium_carterae.2